MARVKTSLRLPCYLSKKKKKKEKKKKKKKNNKQNMVKLHAGCRCSMEERKPSTQSQGSLCCCQETSRAPPPRVPMFFSRYVQFYHGLSPLQEDAVFLQEDAVFLQEDADFLQESADFLQEARTFYRKLCVLQETSCRSLGRPRIHLKRRFNDYGLVWMHASLCWHPCTLLSPCSTILVDMQPSSLHQQSRSMSSQEKANFK